MQTLAGVCFWWSRTCWLVVRSVSLQSVAKDMLNFSFIKLKRAVKWMSDLVRELERQHLILKTKSCLMCLMSCYNLKLKSVCISQYTRVFKPVQVVTFPLVMHFQQRLVFRRIGEQWSRLHCGIQTTATTYVSAYDFIGMTVFV